MQWLKQFFEDWIKLGLGLLLFLIPAVIFWQSETIPQIDQQEKLQSRLDRLAENYLNLQDKISFEEISIDTNFWLDIKRLSQIRHYAVLFHLDTIRAPLLEALAINKIPLNTEQKTQLIGSSAKDTGSFLQTFLSQGHLNESYLPHFRWLFKSTNSIINTSAETHKFKISNYNFLIHSLQDFTVQTFTEDDWDELMTLVQSFSSRSDLISELVEIEPKWNHPLLSSVYRLYYRDEVMDVIRSLQPILQHKLPDLLILSFSNNTSPLSDAYLAEDGILNQWDEKASQLIKLYQQLELNKYTLYTWITSETLTADGMIALHNPHIQRSLFNNSLIKLENIKPTLTDWISGGSLEKTDNRWKPHSLVPKLIDLEEPAKAND